MTETWVRDQFAVLMTAPVPPPGYTDLIAQGKRLRHRRQARVGAVIVAATLIAVGVPVAIAHTGDRAGTSQLVPGSTTSPSSHDALGEASPYWFEQDEEFFYRTTSKGVLQLQSDLRFDSWLGHDRSSVTGRGNGPGYTDLTLEPAFGRQGSSSGTAHGWDDQWRTPTDTASVRTYLKAYEIFAGNSSESSVYRDEDLFSAGASGLEIPGPAAFRTAIIGVMKGLPEVTTRPGTDAAGRPATMLTFDEGPTGATITAYLDLPATALLETVEQLHVGGTSSHTVSVDQPRREDIWRDTGPVSSVPAGATTTAQQEAASKAHPQGLVTPHRQGAAGQPCTPGVPEDVNKVRDRLASMCLDTTVPRFTARAQEDSAAVDGSGFYLSDGALPKPVKEATGVISQGVNGAEMSMQILPGLKSFILSGGSHDLTPRNGRVGTTTYVGTTTVLGVTADEVTIDNQLGILVNIDGMSLESYADNVKGSPPVTYAQMVAVIDHLRWHRLGS